MSITTTGTLGPLILQSLAPAMLYVPTPNLNYSLVADKAVMPRSGGTTMRFMRPRNFQPPTTQLGNSGVEPPSQIPHRDVIDAVMSFYGTSVLINEQVLLQSQEGVLAWTAERLAVSMRVAEDIILRDFLVSNSSQINASAGSNSDNPTNLGASDFSIVAATLDSNSAQKFVTGIDGTDAFGKYLTLKGLRCAEVKFPLIDLELLAGSAEDNRGQAVERRAA